MSLEVVINEKGQGNRHMLLSNYLKDNDVGVLTENESIFFKHIFEKFYTPDEEYTKFNVSQISNISIVKNKYGNKEFRILVDNTWYPASIKRLSGSNRTDKANLIRALRNTINPQIIKFRARNPLNPNDICPVTKKNLGTDAQVDHQIPFHILAEEWIQDNNNNNIKYPYDMEKFDYILEGWHYNLWYNFHLEKAKLRWVSKEGNKYAHTLYSS